MNKIKVKEIFESIQGEGPYVGYKQLFIRFCNCNLKCNYCDTEFIADGTLMEFNPCELADRINSSRNIHSVSLTGGEPLLSVDFLKDFLPRVNKKIYLETNATLADKFLEIKHLVDIVSADIKLESATGIRDTYKFHDKFFEACKGVETFAKIVFNQNITDKEIEQCCELGKKYGIELILQPETVNSAFVSLVGEGARTDEVRRVDEGELPILSVSSDFASQTLEKFLEKYDRVRLIPQVHKFLDVR